jgi:hypothetical protein
MNHIRFVRLNNFPEGLLELWTRYNGSNNGDLSVSYMEAARLLAMSKTTAARAFREIEQRGFATRTSAGQWYGRKAATWRLTMLPCRDALASHDYRRWQPASPRVAASDAMAGSAAGIDAERKTDFGTDEAREAPDGAE